MLLTTEFVGDDMRILLGEVALKVLARALIVTHLDTIYRTHSIIKSIYNDANTKKI